MLSNNSQVSKEDLKSSTQVAASLFFQNVFGSSGAVRGLNFLIALSAFGNLIAVLLGTSRAIRECGRYAVKLVSRPHLPRLINLRQGVLPFPRFWATTWPFGTPSGPYFIKWVLTILMILAPPAGDAFNFSRFLSTQPPVHAQYPSLRLPRLQDSSPSDSFTVVVDLQVYPSSLFAFLLSIGLLLVRNRRGKIGLGRSDFRAWTLAVLFNIAANLFLLIMPWWPPTTGATGGDVSFWYATYVVVGIAMYVFPPFAV